MYPKTRKQAVIYARQITEARKKEFLPFERNPASSTFGLGFCVVENDPSEIADYEAHGWKRIETPEGDD